MAKSQSRKPALPKAVLDMKFMKKTRERIEKELQNTQDHDSLYSNIITSEMRQASGNFITEPSFIYCEDLMDGRLSFKGMNPEIERLMELDANTKKENESGDMEKDVSDEMLAKKIATYKKRKCPFDSPSQATFKKKSKN